MVRARAGNAGPDEVHGVARRGGASDRSIRLAARAHCVKWTCSSHSAGMTCASVQVHRGYIGAAGPGASPAGAIRATRPSSPTWTSCKPGLTRETHISQDESGAGAGIGEGVGGRFTGYWAGRPGAIRSAEQRRRPTRDFRPLPGQPCTDHAGAGAVAARPVGGPNRLQFRSIGLAGTLGKEMAICSFRLQQDKAGDHVQMLIRNEPRGGQSDPGLQGSADAP